MLPVVPFGCVNLPCQFTLIRCHEGKTLLGPSIISALSASYGFKSDAGQDRAICDSYYRHNLTQIRLESDQIRLIDHFSMNKVFCSLMTTCLLNRMSPLNLSPHIGPVTWPIIMLEAHEYVLAVTTWYILAIKGCACSATLLR